jgi:hypothetical protein
MERIGSCEHVFLYHLEGSSSRFTTAFILEKFDAEEMSKYLYSKISALDSIRVKGVIRKTMGTHYYCQMSESEFKSQWRENCKRVDGISDKKSLLRLMSDEYSIEIPLHSLQYQFILIPDYSPTESVLIFKQNHIFGDGCLMYSFIQEIGQGIKPGDIPLSFSIPKHVEWGLSLFGPLIGLYYAAILLMRP